MVSTENWVCLSHGPVSCTHSGKPYTWHLQYYNDPASARCLDLDDARAIADTINMIRWRCTCTGGPESMPHDWCSTLATAEGTTRRTATMTFLDNYCAFMSAEQSEPFRTVLASNALHE